MAPKLSLLTTVVLACAVNDGALAAEQKSKPLVDGPPPNARPGECYAKLRSPARTETYTERVLAEAGRVQRREIPPRYAPERRTVVVREESRRTVHVPPVYETVNETVLVRPAAEKRVVEPAQIRTVHETVPVEGPRLVWKLTHAAHQPAPVWCLVEEPGRVASVSRDVVVRPETVRVVTTPAEYASVPRQVLRSPAGVREEVTPAETREVTVNTLVSPGRVEEFRTEPRYKDVTRIRVVEPGRPEWTPVLCEAEATPHRIKALQGAHQRRNYYRGPVDGLYGPATSAAVKRFQSDRGLPHEGYLSGPTLQALDVPFATGAAPPPSPRPR